ncbi:EmrB/QacA subfamily drug resistance transporter [Saccharothrix coeruleofusca]|uniref:MFS transporter n=1 Tax=Saccharothrix coeruleofusca TaxID=33919 RepID=UPI001AEB264D|nr:MFS transporter [Saccharothrix coeruleofusca]MBP2336898.1 EmrB/QacA subfamily drug resistance transporter [Saccharothrix coeruleofusca]
MSRPQPRPAPSPVRPWAATVVVCLGVFLLGVDLTVLNVAVLDLHRDLSPTMAEVQWIVDAYALVLGGTVLAAGAVTDHFGRRRCFVAGLAVCGTAAALGALAQQPWQAIAARGGMGAGAALLMPATLSIITTLFAGATQRRRALALCAVIAGLGGMTGPVIGGWLVGLSSWRAGFWATVPLAAAAIALALLVVPESRSCRTRRPDLPGAVLCAAALLALVWAVIESPGRGWTSASAVTAFLVGGGLLAAFLVRQFRAPTPLLPLRLLRKPRVGISAVVLVLASFAVFGALFVMTLYLQGVLGRTPWEAGVRTVPMAVALGAGAAAALPLLARWGERVPVVTGLLVISAAFAHLATAGVESGYPHLLLFQVIGGIGAGLAVTAGTEAVMSAVPGHRVGLGSAVNDATRQIGATLGVAVQGSILATVSGARLGQGSVLDAWAVAAHLPERARAAHLLTARHAFVDAMTATAVTAGAVTLVAALLAFHCLPARGALRPEAAARAAVRPPL